MSLDHRHPTTASRRHLRPLAAAFVLVVAFMVAEAIAGWLTGSLALLSDAGHMATDAVGIGMALAAITAAARVGSSGRTTYGTYRLEILAALANAVLLFGVAGYVLYEAVRRLGSPPEILTGPMLAVAIGGLVVNLVSWRLLRSGAEASLNVEGAYVEVLADLAGSIGVIVAAVVVRLTGWTVVDPVTAAGIGLFILPRAWRLGGAALRILIQAAPRHVDLESLERDLRALPGVHDVHDLHVWTLTSDMEVATVHLMTDDDTDPHPVLDSAKQVLDRHGIAHATLQVEPESHEGCAEIGW